MNFLMVVLFVLFTLSSGIEPEIKPYYEQVRRDTQGKLGSGLGKVMFSKVQGEQTLATCYTNTGIIKVSKIKWIMLSDYQRKSLLIHELLHCECNKNHIKGRLNDGCPAHILNPRMGNKYCTKKHYMLYLKQVKDIRCR